MKRLLVLVIAAFLVLAFSGTAFGTTITAPSTIEELASTGSVSVSWDYGSSVSVGEFGAWVRAPGDQWYATTLVAANGNQTYNTNVSLSTVPKGPANEVIVAYRATVGSGNWGDWATSPGNFFVDMEHPHIDVYPYFDSGYFSGDTAVMSSPIYDGVEWSGADYDAGQYLLWARSADEQDWYLIAITAAEGQDQLEFNMDFSEVPTDVDYKMIVGYEPVVGSSLRCSWKTSYAEVQVQQTDYVTMECPQAYDWMRGLALKAITAGENWELVAVNSPSQDVLILADPDMQSSSMMWAAPGEYGYTHSTIGIDADAPNLSYMMPTYFTHYLIHEYGHHAYWALSQDWKDAWADLCTPGYSENTRNENYAEWYRINTFPVAYWIAEYDEPQLYAWIPYHPTATEAYDFVNDWWDSL